MRLFTDEHVAELTWDDVLSALRAAFSDPGGFAMADRVMLPAPGEGAFLTMPCASADGWFGVKQASVLPRNPQRGLPSVQAWYTLFGPDGSPALAGPAALLTRLRTSAVSAVAADVLAPQAARNLLIVGTGSLAPWMARAHLQVRAFETVWVWGRRPERAEAVVAEVLKAFEGRAFRPAVAVADDLESAARQADVISLATTSSQPLLEGAWVNPGQHLDLVGAFLPSMREVDEAAVMACDVFVDQREAARHEAGDLHHAATAGWSWSEIRGDLFELVRGDVGRQPGRPTLFKSVGLALEDLVVARLLAV